jgi:hypothetical protein
MKNIQDNYLAELEGLKQQQHNKDKLHLSLLK